MAFERCGKCGGMHWATDPCRESITPVAATKLERVIPQEQVASDDNAKPARSNTPKPKRDRNEYHKFNMRRWRAKKRAEKAALVNATPAPVTG